MTPKTLVEILGVWPRYLRRKNKFTAMAKDRC